MDHGGADHGFIHPDLVFVIFCESLVFAEPPEHLLEDPPLRQQNEPGRGDGSEHGLENPWAVPFDPTNQVAGITAVGEDRPHLGEPPLRQIEDQLRSVAVLYVRRRHDQRPDHTSKIHENVAFATDDFFSPRRTREGRRDPPT